MYTFNTKKGYGLKMTKRIYQPQISAERIKSRRKELNMTQKELAKKANIAVVTLKKYEAGERVPEEDMRTNLARALNVYEDWIVGSEDYKNLEEKLEHFADNLSGIDTIRETIDLYEAFVALTEALGYKLDIKQNEAVIVNHQGYEKKIPIMQFNKFYVDTINGIRKQYDDLEHKTFDNDATSEEPYIKILNAPKTDGTIKYDDLTQAIADRIKKGGGADDLT